MFIDYQTKTKRLFSLIILAFSVFLYSSSGTHLLKFPLTIGGFYGDTKIEDILVASNNLVIAGETNDSGLVGAVATGVWVKYVVCFDYVTALNYLWRIKLPTTV
jgi:hypothetical protein